MDERDTSEEPLHTGDIGQLLAPRLDDPAAVFMLNLLAFDPDGGAREYGAYGRGMAPVLESVGATIPIEGEVTETLRGEDAWDLVLWVHQRSRRHFLDMVTSELYAGVAGLRTDALVRSELRVTEPVEAGSGGAADPPRTEPAERLADAAAAAFAARTEPDGRILLHELVELAEGGAGGYAAYVAALDGLLSRAGGRIVQACRVAETLIGPPARWSCSLVAELPSRAALAGLYAEDGHRLAEELRAAAILREDVRILDPDADWRTR